MDTSLENIVYVETGVDAGMIASAVKPTDGAPTGSIAGFKYQAVIFNSFNGITYVNTGTKTSATWTAQEDNGVVTQLTSITTAVTLDTLKGVITTVASTLAAGAVAEFTVTNKKVKTTSVILLTVEYATGKTGHPIATVKSRADGSFAVSLRNVHASAAFNDVLKIHYKIEN